MAKNIDDDTLRPVECYFEKKSGPLSFVSYCRVALDLKLLPDTAERACMILWGRGLLKRAGHGNYALVCDELRLSTAGLVEAVRWSGSR